MKRSIVIVVAAVAGLCTASVSWAAPAWGGNCLSCHGDVISDAFTVFGEDGMLDPDESATGAPDRGPLKVIRLRAGQTRTLHSVVTFLSPEDVYAVELKRLTFPGVEHGGRLAYLPDCDWAQWSEPGNHFTDPEIGYRWGTGPSVFAFTLEVAPQAPYDVYDLVYALAGKFQDGGGLFYIEEHFYVEVLPAHGDLDADGDVDLADYGGLAACLAGPEETTPPPGCSAADFASCDADEDGDVDAEDFAAFQRVFAP